MNIYNNEAQTNFSGRIEPGASPQLVFGCLQLSCTKRAQWVCEGVEEIGVGFQQRSMTGPKAHKKDRVRTVEKGQATFRLDTHLHCPRVCWWRIN